MENLKNDVVYLLPEQKKFIEEKIEAYEKAVTALIKVRDSIHGDRLVKHDAGKSGDGMIVETANEEYEAISLKNAEIEIFKQALENSQMPMPYGDEVMVGSLVEFCSKENEISKNYSVLIVEGPYDPNVKMSDGVKLCMTNSKLGEILVGHKALDAITLPNGRQSVITTVDNAYVYNKYPNEYESEFDSFTR